MTRRLALALAALASLVPATAFGLGLGDIRLHSALNQPLDAEIELISATDSEIDALRVRLAAADLFDRYGIERIDALSSLKFVVVRRDDKSAFVRVTSDIAIREPFMTMLVEAQWPRGRLLREYTLLLDPPVLAAPPQAHAEAAPVAAEPAPASVDTGGAAAAALAPTAAQTEAVAEPSAPPVIATPVAPEATGETATPTETGDQGAAPTEYAAGSYGPVKRNEALWTIAKNIRPSDGTTINQMMIALYRANPEAFRNNINVLKRGAILRIPDIAELQAISASEATAEAVRQHQEWEATRVAVAPSAPSEAPVETSAAPQPSMEPTPAPVQQAPVPAPQPEPVAPVVSAPTPAPATSSALSIVAPSDDSGAPSTDPAARVADLETQLAEAKAAGTNSKRKRDRIARLEGELEQARAAIAVPSDTLSQMQAPEPVPSMAPTTVTAAPATTPATVAAAPATVAAAPVEPAKKEKGLLDSILDNLFNPLVLGLLVGIPLLIVLGIVGFKQFKEKAAKRKAQAELAVWATDSGSEGDGEKTVVGGDEPTMQSTRGQGSEERTVIRGPDPALLAATGETVAIPEDQVEKTVMMPRDEMDKTIMQTMVVDRAPAPEPEPDAGVSHDTVVGGTPLKLDENDPMSEADFHMAYGLYDQASDLIKKASQREPGRRDLKLKLLEIYFSAGSKAAFVAEAKALRQSMGASPDADWQNVAIFGKQIAPEEGIFNETVRTAGTTIDFDASMGGGTSPSSAIDLAFDEPSPSPSAPAPAAAAAPKADEPLEFNLADFEMGEAATPAAPAAVAAPTKGEHTDSQSDFDKALAELSSFVETNVPKDVGGTSQAGGTEVDLGSLELDDSALSVEDGGESGSEVDTKLDLARAYIDMGDPGSAKGILEEVVADGDDKQKAEAEKLLKQLG